MAEQDELRAIDATQHHGITQAGRGVHVVARVAQEFAEIRQHVDAFVNAENVRALNGRGGDRAPTFVERGYGIFFAVVNIEKALGRGDFEQRLHSRGHRAKFEIAARLTGSSQQANHRSEAGAIDEAHFAEVKDEGAVIAQKVSDMVAQRFRGLADDNATCARNDSDSTNVARIQGEQAGLQRSSDERPHSIASLGWSRTESPGSVARLDRAQFKLDVIGDVTRRVPVGIARVQRVGVHRKKR